MSMDSTDPTREPGTAGDAKAGVPHLRAPGGPEAPGTRGATTQAPQPSPHGEAGSDPRKRLVAVRSEVGKAVAARRPP